MGDLFSNIELRMRSTPQPNHFHASSGLPIAVAGQRSVFPFPKGRAIPSSKSGPSCFSRLVFRSCAPIYIPSRTLRNITAKGKRKPLSAAFCNYIPMSPCQWRHEGMASSAETVEYAYIYYSQNIPPYYCFRETPPRSRCHFFTLPCDSALLFYSFICKKCDVLALE